MCGIEGRRRPPWPALLAAILCPLAAGADLPVLFPVPGERLDGGQFVSEAGFEIWDWNEDGLADVFVHDFGSTGKGYAYLNEGTPEAPRFTHGIVQPFNSTETEPQTLEHVQARAYGDLNHDGLTDIVFFDGQLRLCPNTGTRTAPYWWSLWTNRPVHFPGSAAMIRENARYSTGPESMYWNKGIFARQVLTLTIADWDGDGLQDLLICRTLDEPPGVQGLGVQEQWTAWGRTAIRRPAEPGRPEPDPAFLAPLKEPPARGLFFYKNRGTQAEPYFDDGVEIRTPDGRSIAAPNPVVADVDGDGIPDLVSTEAPIHGNAFRVDWPTRPHVVWFRRAALGDVATLSAPVPVKDAAGAPVPAGTMARIADFRGPGTADLFVMDSGLKGTIRWYRNTAGAGQARAWTPATVLRGRDFLRFEFMVQPLVVDWFRPGSRDLILHGTVDHHCKWGLRRTALYRNVAAQPGEPRYELAGWFTWNGDPAMVPVREEERQYEAYGSSVSVAPDDGSGKKRIMMSVGGKLYYFSDLAPDGLTFRRMKPIDIPQTRNRHKGWQEIPVDVPFKVRHIRIGNDRNGMGNQRDSFLHIVRFEALAEGRNRAGLADGVQIKKLNTETVRWYQVQNPDAMFTPGNTMGDDQPGFTSFGYFIGPAVITLPEPVALEKIRFQFSDRDSLWYKGFVPFYWQGKLYRMGMEEGENWYQYTVDVSPDEVVWTNVADRMETGMLVSHPLLVDWDRDGKIDLVLGSTSAKGIWPFQKQHRLFRNVGTNDDPRYAEPVSATDPDGRPIVPSAFWHTAYAPQCGVRAVDMDGDGRLDLVVEGFNDGSLEWYRNVGTNAPTDFVFAGKAQVRGGQGVFLPGKGYRYFDITDLDGDGIPDVIHSTGAPFLFKGARSAPPLAAGSPVAGPATAPRLVLRNGPALDEWTPAYSNGLAATLDADKPDEAELNAATLSVFAPVPKGKPAKMALLRFDALPRMTVAKAELELHGPGPRTDMMSCQAVDGAGDFSRVCWNRTSAGRAWGDALPERGGVFQSFARPVFRSAPAVPVRWEVTRAVRAAQEAGRDSVSLLIRLDYTGHYVAGAGCVFAGPAAKEVEHRPRLILTPTP